MQHIVAQVVTKSAAPVSVTADLFTSAILHVFVRRWDEMLFSVFVMLVQVVLEAYILGTLFHYVVKKDAKLEEFRYVLA